MDDDHRLEVLRVASRQMSEHVSADDAIVESVGANDTRTIDGIERVIGQCIVDVRCDYRRVCCRVGSGHNMCFNCSNADDIDVVILGVFDDCVVDSMPSEPIRLQSNGHIWIWDRTNVANNMLGRAIAKVFFTKWEVYLYLSPDQIVSFSSMRLIPSGEPLLYWDLSD